MNFSIPKQASIHEQRGGLRRVFGTVIFIVVATGFIALSAMIGINLNKQLKKEFSQSLEPLISNALDEKFVTTSRTLENSLQLHTPCNKSKNAEDFIPPSNVSFRASRRRAIGIARHLSGRRLLSQALPLMSGEALSHWPKAAASSSKLKGFFT